ncbi:putative membrane protein YfcA [Amorphus suaedae]
MPWHVVAIGCAIVVFAAGLRRMTGFGFAMVTVSLLSLMIGPKQAVLATLILQLFLGARNTQLIVRDTRWRLLPWLLGAGLLAVPVGLAIQHAVDDRTLRLLVGVSVLSALAPILGRNRPPIDAGWLGGSVSGFLAGLLNSLAAMPAPPLLLYLMRLRDLSLDARRATLITMFTLLTLAALAGHLIAGGMDRSSALLAVILCPAALVGDHLGRSTPWSMNRRVIDALSIAIVVGSASILVVSALTS